VFCVRPFALHREQPEKDKQNVDIAPQGKISADAHGNKYFLAHYLSNSSKSGK